jgi:rare lipoprotein A (peptidoglycan hydrolase)
MRIDLIRWGESVRQGRSAAPRCRASPSAHPAGVPKTMRVKFNTATTLLALLAAAATAAFSATSAFATTGGASAPTGSTPTSTTPTQVHPTGLATWFGPGFYGKETACGQTLTPEVVGVANRTLPCGTLVKVTYGSHTLTVPVLDRGPYSNIGASWDLTAGAASALGITETVKIHTAVVGSTPNTPTLGLPPGAPVAPVAGGVQAAEA